MIAIFPKKEIILIAVFFKKEIILMVVFPKKEIILVAVFPRKEIIFNDIIFILGKFLTDKIKISFFGNFFQSTFAV